MGRSAWSRWVVLGVAWSGLGCSSLATPAPQSAAVAPQEALPELEGTGLEPARAEAAPRGRRVGDYVAQRFSGTFRERPFTLVEEVVGREGGLVVVDFTLEQADEKRVLRVRFDEATERPVSAAHVRGLDEV